MWPHCLLFVHLGHCACIQIGCLVEGWRVGGRLGIFQVTLSSQLLLAAWRGKAVKAARPLCLPPSSLRCILPHPHPSYSPAWPPDFTGRHWLPRWGPSGHPSRFELPVRALRQWWYLQVEQEMSVALQLLLNRASAETQAERWVKPVKAGSL